MNAKRQCPIDSDRLDSAVRRVLLESRSVWQKSENEPICCRHFVSAALSVEPKAVHDTLTHLGLEGPVQGMPFRKRSKEPRAVDDQLFRILENQDLFSALESAIVEVLPARPFRARREYLGALRRLSSSRESIVERILGEVDQESMAREYGRQIESLAQRHDRRVCVTGSKKVAQWLPVSGLNRVLDSLAWEVLEELVVAELYGCGDPFGRGRTIRWLSCALRPDDLTRSVASLLGAAEWLESRDAIARSGLEGKSMRGCSFIRLSEEAVRRLYATE